MPRASLRSIGKKRLRRGNNPLRRVHSPPGGAYERPLEVNSDNFSREFAGGKLDSISG